MTLSSGTRLGPYEVVAPLGAGGMGEVWKARDTRLERSVAIKVLPTEFATNAQLKLRFEREAKTISQLTHPNICTLYDVGDGYLVMELLDGETLADRIAKGSLPLDQVIRIGTEIANALDRAHKAGIVHRDLKPSNVMLTKSGAKLLDFGLAKESSVVTDATVEKALTGENVIVGTMHYMAPEQIEGGAVDARTDIFALGALLYEMTTGKRAFGGKSKASVIAAVLTLDPPPLATVQPASPPALDRLIRTCLAKDPDERWQSAHDVALELRNITDRAETKVAPRAANWWLPVVAAALAAALTWGAIEWRKQPPRMIASSILPPDGTEFAFEGGGSPVLSPDGTRIAFVAGSPGIQRMLYVRSLSSTIAQPLAGTETASYPFWSPDGRSIGFFADGKLKKIDAAGGAAQSLADATAGRGGSWSPAGVIVFSPTTADGIYKVSEDGGAASRVTRMNAGDAAHRFPFFLPDGHHFLFELSRHGGSATPQGIITIGSIDGDMQKPVANANSNAIYADGSLLYLQDNSLVARPFDAKSFAAGSKLTVIAEGLTRTNIGGAIISVSNNGTLLYESGAVADLSHLQWYDASGKPLDVFGKPRDLRTPSLSHDGRRVAISVMDRTTNHTDIWIDDLQRGTSTRLTFDAANEFLPIWSPDDSTIVYGSNGRGLGDLMLKSTSGTGAEQVLFASMDFKVPYDWSPDGKLIVFQDQSPSTAWDIWLYSLPEHRAWPLVRTPATEFDPKFSPDGKFVAYQSDESSQGRYQIYVLPVSGGPGKWQISTDGGRFARWSPDGKQLYYVDDASRLMAVDVAERGGEFLPGVPRPLFSIAFPATPGTQFDVSRDGKRFLINTPVTKSDKPPLTLVQNWTAAVKR